MEIAASVQSEGITNTICVIWVFIFNTFVVYNSLFCEMFLPINFSFRTIKESQGFVPNVDADISTPVYTLHVSLLPMTWMDTS